MSWQLASFAILALALGAGFAWYERSRPSSRTVALVATLAALATLGRLAFAAVPDVKPMTDIVLLTGYALGGAPGFTVGAVSAIASNVVLTEGPWTPWQMLAWGLVGVAGALVARSRRGRRPPSRLAMALICALAGFGFGFVVDLYTWLGFSGHTLAQYLAVEGAAFPFNLTHAISNAAFYLAFGPAFLRALTRFRARLSVEWGTAAAAALIALVLLVGTAAAAAPRAVAATTPLAAAAPRAVAATTPLAAPVPRTAAATTPLAAPVPRTAAATTPLAAPVPRTAAATTPLAAPTHYLLSAQNADGGFGMSRGSASNGEATCWAVLGLAAARGPRSPTQRAATWIAEHLDQIQTPGDLERTILALAAAHAPLTTLTTQLQRDVATDGSVHHQANWTAFAILALRAAGIAPHALAPEHTWLEHQQNANGSFSFGTRGDPGDIDDTAGALEALVAANAPPAPERAARHFLTTQEQRDGGFPLEPGESSNAQSTAWAVQALLAVHAPVARAIAYLEARTTPGGVVDYAAGTLQTPVWVTGEALTALARAPLPLR
jgi:energy-coupling factor transport system substrate-specific component